jgi:Fe-S cluster assembly protein SufD
VEPFGQWAKGQETCWRPEFRQAGLERFTSVGLPNTKHEDWRFTPLTPLSKMPFRPLLAPSAGSPAHETVEAQPFGRLDTIRLVFVDGHFTPCLSRVEGLPAGVVVEAYSSQANADGAGLPAEVGRWAPVELNPFAALNAAYFTDGAALRVARGVEVTQPVHLVHLTTAGDSGSSANTRNLIVLEEGAALTVLETYASLTGAPHFTNTVVELDVGPEARLEHLRFQDENASAVHMATVGGRFDRSSQAWLHSFALGARLSRANLRTQLMGEGLECVLNGLYLTRGEQLADHHMVVDHAAPHCASHEYFNGILDDRSRGVFHGRILVRPEAQKTDAKQTSKNILLSDAAKVDAKPQLEIYADDVKCTHGATVGQLDDDSIFYLRARGLGVETARRMLIHAFAGEIIERVQCSAVREELDQRVWNRLEQNPHIRADHV